MIQSNYTPFGAGLDEESSLTNPKAGFLLGVENYELVFGAEGLRRVNGYEAFDGNAEPHLASLTMVTFAAGSAAIAAGDTVTTAGGSCHVLRASLSSGSWAGADAAGTLAVTAVTGTISGVMSVGGSPKATATASNPGAIDDANYTNDIAAARDYYRALIAKPPGEGAILGCKVWDGTALVLRNAAGGATAALWRSSAAGWVAVRTGLRPSGRLRGVVCNFTGDSAARAAYLVDGKNRYFRLSADWTVTFGPAVYPTEATSATSLTPGSGSKAFTFSETSRSWATGQRVIAYSAANAANYMAGAVASSTSSTVTITVDVFGGTTAADWHLCTEAGTDRPFLVAEHKNYLMLGYPRGQLQTTDVGDPMTVGLSSDAFGAGDELRDLRGMRGNVLAAFTAHGVSLLYGDGSVGAPWEMRAHDATNGSMADGAQEIGGDAVYLSAAGVHSLTTSQNFGDYAYTNIGARAQRSLRDLLRDFHCSTLSRKDGQYRLYGADGLVVVMTVYGPPSAKNVRFTRCRYPDQPVCADSEILSDGTEFMIFGTDDGWVMRERVGTTFNGADISAFFRTSYWHAGTPQTRKRWRKLILDIENGLSQTALLFRQDIDFASADQAEAFNVSFVVRPGGGLWSAAYFGEFLWGGEIVGSVHASIDGIGRHMSVIVVSNGDAEPHTARGMHAQFSPLGIQR